MGTLAQPPGIMAVPLVSEQEKKYQSVVPHDWVPQFVTVIGTTLTSPAAIVSGGPGL
jgi:hypothetical protein